MRNEFDIDAQTTHRENPVLVVELVAWLAAVGALAYGLNRFAPWLPDWSKVVVVCGVAFYLVRAVRLCLVVAAILVLAGTAVELLR